MVRVIGYYVHHHGRGHVNRALAIGARLAEPVTYFCSLPRPPELPAGAGWVQLPMDIAPEQGHIDTEAGGRLHWAPLRVSGLAQRSATILSSAVEVGVRHFVVDVSVEVTLLARVAGFPVTILAAPGVRSDTAHQLGYDIAERITRTLVGPGLSAGVAEHPPRPDPFRRCDKPIRGTAATRPE